jgi:hypothetical protein
MAQQDTVKEDGRGRERERERERMTGKETKRNAHSEEIQPAQLAATFFLLRSRVFIAAQTIIAAK